ncbi:MAG: D-glycero-beta-D-manno-heptose 1-phosphate adenylyltransferase [Flavobacteriales bacterium]|nr:D-glycero-beta-D-manno-heptose 1-phosphate adenylyltransferase [Flavobacteriales bacterium]
MASKIQSIEQSNKTIENWRKEKETIVFTNGCFDLLHLGHIDYLTKAKDLGSKLIIGVNSSQSVTRLKGPTRPINSTETRAFMLAAFKFVDLVVIFEDDTPIDLISNIKPNILVKGGDYTLETVVGAKEVMKYGGDVKIIPFLEGFSTTSIVTKIQSFSRS